MSAPRILSLVAALVFAAQAHLFAQEEPPVVPGDRVRIAAPTVDPDDWLVGTLVETAADTCVLAVENQADTLALPFAWVVQDNGEGAEAPKDQISLQWVHQEPGFAANFCATGEPWPGGPDPITGGNILVRP
jgi:hypothetical protein